MEPDLDQYYKMAFRNKIKNNGPKTIIAYAMPAVILVYVIVLAEQRLVSKSSGETFPFFSWSLFSSTHKPDYFVKYYIQPKVSGSDALGEHSGMEALGNLGIRAIKAVKAIEKYCAEVSRSKCDHKASELMSQYFNPDHYTRPYTFSIMRCHTGIKDYSKSMRASNSVRVSPSDCGSINWVGQWTLQK